MKNEGTREKFANLHAAGLGKVVTVHPHELRRAKNL